MGRTYDPIVVSPYLKVISVNNIMFLGTFVKIVIDVLNNLSWTQCLNKEQYF